MNSNLNKTALVDILIVDDTSENLRLLSSILTEQGYEVRKAINGEMALTAVKTLKPDLIMLDINMPGLNGYEVCKILKKNPQTQAIPVIFLSALNEPLDKVKAFQVGGVDYITKPFHFEEVIARIKNQLKIHSLQVQLQTQNAQLQQALNELKKTQAQLIQSEKMASLGQLVAGLAHELNNPVSFIAGNLAPAREYIQNLLQLINLYQQEVPIPTTTIQQKIKEIDLEFLRSDLQQLLNSMQSGVERIRSIMLGLRIFSRLGESDIKAIDIHEAIDSTLLMLQHKLKQEEKNLEIQIIKDYGVLPLVTCYASQINQVFLNLLNNAIDAVELQIEQSTEARQATIWISTELTASDKVTIKIKDNGIGVPEEILSHLFDPFFTKKPVGKGMGLGLFTSYQIVVEKHKGQINCSSKPGEGAEFIVKIPVNLKKNV